MSRLSKSPSQTLWKLTKSFPKMKICCVDESNHTSTIPNNTFLALGNFNFR